MLILGEFIPKKDQFMSIHVRVFLIYTAQAPHIYIASLVFDPKTNISTQMNKKNLKNPKFPPISKISFLRNVNLRKLRAYPNNRVVMRPSEKFEAKAAGQKCSEAWFSPR